MNHTDLKMFNLKKLGWGGVVGNAAMNIFVAKFL